MKYRYRPTEVFLLAMGVLSLIALLGIIVLTMGNTVQEFAINKQTAYVLAPTPRSQYRDIRHCHNTPQPLWDCIINKGE